MKKLFIIAALLLFTTTVYAETPNSATSSAAQQKLDTLKDRLASAATQLSQSQKGAIFGTVKTTSVSTITVETSVKDMKIELTDTIKVAQVLKGKRTSLTTDDLSKGDTVVVFGDYDVNLDLLKAKAIFIQDTLPLNIAGTITQTDKKNFTITVATPAGQTYLVDIETLTKNILWDKANGTSKGAFSKYLVGDTVHLLATPEPKTDNRVSAIRVLDIGNITGAATAPAAVPTVSSSPSATLKVTPKPTPTP